MCRVPRKQAGPKLQHLDSKSFQELSWFPRIVNSGFFPGGGNGPRKWPELHTVLGSWGSYEDDVVLMLRGHLRFPGGGMSGSTCVRTFSNSSSPDASSAQLCARLWESTQGSRRPWLEGPTCSLHHRTPVCEQARNSV